MPNALVFNGKYVTEYFAVTYILLYTNFWKENNQLIKKVTNTFYIELKFDNKKIENWY